MIESGAYLAWMDLTEKGGSFSVEDGSHDGHVVACLATHGQSRYTLALFLKRTPVALLVFLQTSTMDVDWCLTCEKSVEAPNLYCSLDCRYHAASTSTLFDQDEDSNFIIFHPVDAISSSVEQISRWTGNDFAGISAWAAEVPYGPPADFSTSSSPSHSVHHPPQLLARHPRTIPPALCTDTFRQTSSSTPLNTLKPRHPTMHPPDAGRISLKSALTESSLATPASSHPMPISTVRRPPALDGIGSHVHSWVTPSPTSPTKVKPFKPTSSALPNNTRLHTKNVTSIKVISPPDTRHGFVDPWKLSTIILEQPSKRAPEPQRLRGCRLPNEFPRMANQNSSFRGRQSSRAVA